MTCCANHTKFIFFLYFISIVEVLFTLISYFKKCSKSFSRVHGALKILEKKTSISFQNDTEIALRVIGANGLNILRKTGHLSFRSVKYFFFNFLWIIWEFCAILDVSKSVKMHLFYYCINVIGCVYIFLFIHRHFFLVHLMLRNKIKM